MDKQKIKVMCRKKQEIRRLNVLAKFSEL